MNKDIAQAILALVRAAAIASTAAREEMSYPGHDPMGAQKRADAFRVLSLNCEDDIAQLRKQLNLPPGR